MEIPTISADLYRQKPKHFETELDRGLRAATVVQISGLEQQVVNDFYGKLDEHKQMLLNSYYDKIRESKSEEYLPDLGKHFFLDNLCLSPADDIMEELYKKDPRVESLVKEIKKQASYIARICTEVLHRRYEITINRSRELFLNRYLKLKGLKSKRGKKLMLPEHKDVEDAEEKKSAFLVIAPPASTRGLQGYVKEEWTDIAPQKDHALVWLSQKFEENTPLKALYHRVLHPKSDRYALLYF